MGAHPVPVEKHFPERDYPELLEAYRRSMLRELDLIDQQTNWSDRLFTPLEAEVEVTRSGRPRRQLTDLLTALKSEKTDTPALVIGEPGSGKSVALRRLCRLLLDEVTPTGKLPIYINLKEWETETALDDLPLGNIDKLKSFILRNLLERGDIDAHAFLNAYFNKMYEHHRIFFILDSFDEIPAVMDVSEDSPLIDKISLLFSKFLGHATRGVLASRPFKQPTLSFVPGTRVDVRPFDEARIARTLQNGAQLPHHSVRTLFQSAPHLLSLARNPMMASLLANYLKTNPGKTPTRQADLYENYLRERLRASSYETARMGFNNDSILEASCALAATMFAEGGLGLEAPLETLASLLPKQRVRDVVAVLRHARIGRLGIGVQERFSFVHRRFNEYFVVQALLKEHEPLHLEDIPNNGRYRDALVLYCEVASDESATAVASYCWRELGSKKDGIAMYQYTKSIQCLRFLAEAFRARRACVGEFAEALGDLIRANLRLGGDLLFAKLSTEAIGILPDAEIESLVVQAMRLGNTWIRQTALRSCRHLAFLGEDLKNQLMIYLAELEPGRLLKKREQLAFSLSLSEAFASVRQYLKVLRCDVLLAKVGLLIATILSPILMATFMLLARTGEHLGRLGQNRMMVEPESREMLFGLVPFKDYFKLVV
jgi:hypothetical protein